MYMKKKEIGYYKKKRSIYCINNKIFLFSSRHSLKYSDGQRQGGKYCHNTF